MNSEMGTVEAYPEMDDEWACEKAGDK